MDKEFNLVAALRTFFKWKKPIFILTIVSGIIAALVSVFVMDEYFYSYSTFYPINQIRFDRSIIFGGEAVGYFGDKSDINRTITIANSNPVIDFVIDSFSLAGHYKIDKNKKYWKTMARKKFEKNYEAIKTERDAVQVSLYDTDPKLAAAMVNTIVKKVDDLNRLTVMETKQNSYNTIVSEMHRMQDEINIYVDTLSKLSEKYHVNIKAGTDGTVIIDGDNYHAAQIYRTIFAKQGNATRELNNMQNIKSQLEVSMKSNESSLYVLEQAFPADRKEKPIRSLVILITMLVTLFVSTIGVFLIEQIRELKAQL